MDNKQIAENLRIQYKKIAGNVRQEFKNQLEQEGSLKCGLCSKPIHVIDSFDVDHIIPIDTIAKNPTPENLAICNTLDNLQITHSTCNKRASSKIHNNQNDNFMIRNNLTYIYSNSDWGI